MINWKKLLFAAVLVAATLLTAFFAVAAGERGKQQSFKSVWTVEANFPKLDNPGIDEAVTAWLTEHIESAVDAVKGCIFPSDPEFAWNMGVDYEVAEYADRAVNVVFTSVTYPQGAAHPMSEINVLSFSLPEGKLLTFDDLFAKPDQALAIFAAKSPDLVADGYKDQYDVFSRDELREIMLDDGFKDGFKPERDNYATWAVEEGGLRLYFHLYQVLPYVFGIPTVLIPLEDLTPAGPNPSLWPKK